MDQKRALTIFPWRENDAIAKYADVRKDIFLGKANVFHVSSLIFFSCLFWNNAANNDSKFDAIAFVFLEEVVELVVEIVIVREKCEESIFVAGLCVTNKFVKHHFESSEAGEYFGGLSFDGFLMCLEFWKKLFECVALAIDEPENIFRIAPLIELLLSFLYKSDKPFCDKAFQCAVHD